MLQERLELGRRQFLGLGVHELEQVDGVVEDVVDKFIRYERHVLFLLLPAHFVLDVPDQLLLLDHVLILSHLLERLLHLVLPELGLYLVPVQELFEFVPTQLLVNDQRILYLHVLRRYLLLDLLHKQ